MFVLEMNQHTQISEQDIEKAAYILKTLSHPMRLKIVQLLGGYGPLSVNDLSEQLHCDQSLMSHHLSTMKLKGILSSERKGQKHIYALREHNIMHIFESLQHCKCNYS